VRAGHTAASVDISRLACLNASAVICEIMNEDGTMSGMDDLIAYRREHDHLIERRPKRQFSSHWGDDWRAICFYNKATRGETLALVKWEVDLAKPTLVRMHLLSILPDVFAEIGERGSLVQRSMETIAREGGSILALINRPVPDFVSRAMRIAGGREYRTPGIGRKPGAARL
tara:strand:- start:271 stop:786 length:516 start_codon:yes stop_codon:yes gene_type:complete